MKHKKLLSFGEKLLLFDYENHERKVLANPAKYDKQGFIPMVAKARAENKEHIRIWRGNIYMADQVILKSLGAFTEDDECGSCGWYCYIFLNQVAYEKHMKRKEEFYLEQLGMFFQAGIL
jgi:hypothetical protein